MQVQKAYLREDIIRFTPEARCKPSSCALTYLHHIDDSNQIFITFHYVGFNCIGVQLHHNKMYMKTYDIKSKHQHYKTKTDNSIILPE